MKKNKDYVRTEKILMRITLIAVFIGLLLITLTGNSQFGNEENKNKMLPTKSIHLYTEYTGKYAELGITKELNFIPPSGSFFKDTKYYVNEVLQ